MVQGDKSLKATLAQQKSIAPATSEGWEREANENIQTLEFSGEDDPGESDNEYADLVVARTWHLLHGTARTAATSDPPESKNAEKTVPDEEGWHVLIIAHSDTVRTSPRPQDEKAIAEHSDSQQDHSGLQSREFQSAYSEVGSGIALREKAIMEHTELPVKSPSRAAVRRQQTANRRLGRSLAPPGT